MRILFVIENRPHEHAGGRYHGLLHALSLAELGHEVTYCTNVLPIFYDDVLKYFKVNENTWKVHLTKKWGWDIYKDGYDLFIGFPVIGGDAAAWFGHECKKPAISVILESPQWVSSVYGRDVTRDAEWKDWGNYIKAFDKNAWCLDTSLEGSKYSLQWIKAQYPEYDASHMLQCYCPINDRAISSDSSKRFIPYDQRQNQIMFIGRLVTYKNYCLPIEIAATHQSKPSVVVIAGHWLKEHKEALETQAKKANVQLQLLFHITEEQKFSLIKNSKLMINASLFEGLSLSPIEAAFCFTPCIAYDLPIMREVHTVNDKCVVHLAKWGNIKDAIQKAHEVLNFGDQDGFGSKKDRINIMKSYRDRFSIDAVKNKLDTIVRKICQ